MSGPKLRQAVVVVHGMGEQVPMETVRGVADVMLEPPAGGQLYYSRPDQVSERNQYDLRRYVAPARSDKNHQTEFFEYHWAHVMTGNTMADLLPLVRRVFLRLPWKIGGLWRVWLLGIGLALGLLAVAVLVGVTYQDVLDLDEYTFESIVGLVATEAVTLWILGQVWKKLTRLLIGWFADAARYWNARPRHRDARNAIREGLVELLEGLHASGRYSRIIVAAHSLGSVICHDAIGFLWAKHNLQYVPPSTASSYPNLKKLEEEGTALADKAGEPDETALKNWQKAQSAAWREQREVNGNPWLVTDFITFGSPLAHAEILMVGKREEFRDRLRMREAPTCPPVPQPFTSGTTDQYHGCVENKVDGETTQVKLLYHAAPFAVIRWTNLYYSADWFAGPVRTAFGSGVVDIPLETDGVKSKVPLAAHTAYLKYPELPTAGGATVGGATDSFRLAADLNRTQIPVYSPPPKCVIKDATGGFTDCQNSELELEIFGELEE